MIDIKGLNKAEVLKVLYDNAKTQGLGLLQYTPEDMTIGQAEELILSETSFDYVQGRVLKVELDGDEFSEWGYDRDNGQGSAQRCIDTLR